MSTDADDILDLEPTIHSGDFVADIHRGERIQLPAQQPSRVRQKISADTIAVILSRECSMSISEAFTLLRTIDFETAAIQWENNA